MKIDVLWIIGSFVIGLYFGAIIGTKVTDSNVRSDAIRHDHAMYDAKTGKFRWKTENEMEEAMKIKYKLVPGIDYDPLPLPVELNK